MSHVMGARGDGALEREVAARPLHRIFDMRIAQGRAMKKVV